jgi:hypothetical protein
MTGWTNEQIVNGVANGCNQVRAANGDRAKSNPVEFANFASDVASKTDLAPMAHQVKYRIKDEQAAGVTSPVVEAKKEMELSEQRAKQLEHLKANLAKSRENEQTKDRRKGMSM